MSDSLFIFFSPPLIVCVGNQLFTSPILVLVLHLQHKLEQFKTQSDDTGTLQLLRQLRFLENECKEETQDMDLEAVLLEVIIG
jgi:hypothetical protein